MIRFAVFVGVCLSLVASQAEACQRCGLFGRRCQFQQVQHVQHVAQQVAFVQPYVAPVASPEVLVVNNQYAAPNGAAAFLAPQGQTVYGLQQAAQAYTLDPSAVLRQAAELTKGAQALAGQGLQGYQQTATVALQLNAGANDTLARGIAASSILQSAGLSTGSAQNQSQALRIYRDQSGQWQVEQGEQVTAKITASVRSAVSGGDHPPMPGSPSEAAGVVGGESLVKQYCAKCHGLQMPEPRAGLFFDAGHQLECKPSLKAVRSVSSGTMPKGQQLPPDIKEALIKELVSLTPDE